VQPRPVLLRHANDVHRIPSLQLWPPVHVTSHAQELAHETLRHDCTPEHSTAHGPGPQTTSSQLCRPVHSTAHAVLCSQLTPLRHAFSTLHRMVQL